MGEYESGTLEMLESTACQLAFSEMRIPFPSHHVFTQSGLMAYRERVHLTGLMGPDKMWQSEHHGAFVFIGVPTFRDWHACVYDHVTSLHC